MNPPLDGDQQILDQTMDRFIRQELDPLEEGAAWRDHEEVPQDVTAWVRRRSAELGLYAPDAAEQMGGRGLSQLAMVLLRERAFAHPSRLSNYVVHGPEGPSGILRTGTSAQQAKYLRPLVEGRATRCLAITEPGAGSDVQAIATRAEHRDSGWVINGRKTFITNAAEADFAIVLAKTTDGPPGRDGISAFIVPRGTPGFTIVRRLRGLSAERRHYEVAFEDCVVPDDQLVGDPSNVGAAFAGAVRSFATGRLAIAAECLGMAQRALDLGMEYARSREAFGSTLASYQYVQGHLVESYGKLQMVRLATHEAARRYDQGHTALLESSLAKLYATEFAFEIVDRMISIHGGMGWSSDLPLERMLRTLRTYRIVDGPSDLQRVIIGKLLLDS